MAAVEDARIQRRPVVGGSRVASEIFIFRALAPLSNKKSQPAIAIPLVNLDSASNVLFRFQGQSEEATFTFAIFDDGTDVAVGSHTSAVITVAQQIQYLRDNIYTAEFDTEWRFTQSRYFPDGVDGVITDLTFDNPAGAGTVVVGILIFKRGNIGEA